MLTRWSNDLNNLIIEKHLFLPNDKILIAVSGGQDSMLLVTLLNHLQPFWNWQLAIVHCDHRWQSNSFTHSCQIYRLASVLKKPIYIIISTLTLMNENHARYWRYSNIYQICIKKNYTSISLGHTKSDKVETFFLNCLRGSGLKGLESIKWKRDLTIRTFIVIWYDDCDKGNFIETSNLYWSIYYFSLLKISKQPFYKVRPLLFLSRETIRIAIKKLKIPLCLDYTNYNIDFRRNRIRHQLIPYIKRYFNPQIEVALSNLTDIIHSDNIYLNAVTKSLCKQMKNIDDSKPYSIISLEFWQSLPIAIQRRVLIHLLCINSLNNCSFQEIEKVRLSINQIPKIQSYELVFESMLVQLTLHGSFLRIQNKI